MKRADTTRKLELGGSQILEQMRECWLSNVIHDFSNPLFSARGYVRLVLEERDGPLPESSRRYLNSVLENIGTLTALARELKDYRANENFELELFSFRDLLLDAISEVVPLSAGDNLNLRQTISNEPLYTIGDRQKLGQALRGFLSAVIQSANRGGQIEVSAGEDDDRITMRLTASGAAPVGGFQPDVSAPSRLWRLHGGITSFGNPSGGVYSFICELPVIREPLRDR
jgi:signal transduction histidine kinase